MQLEPRNTDAPRPDAGLRWAGRILFLTAIVLITDLALQPGFEMPARLFGSDKIEHVGAFLVLTLLAKMGWPTRSRILIGLILFLYGFAIEYLQSTSAIGRTASIADLVAERGLPIANDVRAEERVRQELRLLFSLVQVAHDYTAYEDRVRTAAMIALGAVVDGEAPGLREEEWVAWWERREPALRAELERLGVRLRWKPMRWPEMKRALRDQTYDVVIGGWSLAWDTDPYQLWHSSQADKKGSSNRARFKNKEADALLERLRSTFRQRERVELLLIAPVDSHRIGLEGQVDVGFDRRGRDQRPGVCRHLERRRLTYRLFDWIRARFLGPRSHSQHPTP